MIDTVQKVVRLTMMLNDNERVSVRKIQTEFGLSRSTTYRWLKSVSKELPIKTDGGVVRMEKKKEASGAQGMAVPNAPCNHNLTIGE